MEELTNCALTYTWGRKYCIEFFNSGKWYISYNKGHVLIGEESKKNFLNVIEKLNKRSKKESLFGLEIEIDTSPKLNRMCMKEIIRSMKEEETEDEICISKGVYISKRDYDLVVRHYLATQYGESLDDVLEKGE